VGTAATSWALRLLTELLAGNVPDATLYKVVRVLALLASGSVNGGGEMASVEELLAKATKAPWEVWPNETKLSFDSELSPRPRAVGALGRALLLPRSCGRACTHRRCAMKFAMFTTALYVLACLIHEAGHASAAAWFGLPWKLRFGWLGPYVRVQGRYVAHENAAVALGGPIASIVGGLIVWIAGLPACAIIVGAIGAANVLDFWHAIKALQLSRMKGGNHENATS